MTEELRKCKMRLQKVKQVVKGVRAAHRSPGLDLGQMQLKPASPMSAVGAKQRFDLRVVQRGQG